MFVSLLLKQKAKSLFEDIKIILRGLISLLMLAEKCMMFKGCADFNFINVTNHNLSYSSGAHCCFVA